MTIPRTTLERRRLTRTDSSGQEWRVCLAVLGPLGALVATRYTVGAEARAELERRLHRPWDDSWSIDAHVPIELVDGGMGMEGHTSGGTVVQGCEFVGGGACYCYGSSWACRDWGRENIADDVAYAWLEAHYAEWLTQWRERIGDDSDGH